MAERRAASLVAPRPSNGTTPSPAPDLAIGRRRALPGGRAVVGGLLVAASAVGMFAAYGAAEGGPTDAYVTAAGDIEAGQVLSPSDLRAVPIDLPSAQRAVSFTDEGLLAGKVTTARLRKGELVQSADVARFVGVGDRAQISIGVEPGSAMNGRSTYLAGGERVDVIVTFTQGGTPVTKTVARDAVVVEVIAGDSRLGTSGRLTVVLAVPPKDLEPIAGAAAAGKITLARTTGLDR